MANQEFESNDREMNRVRHEAMALAGIGLCRCTFDGAIVFMDPRAIELLELEDTFPDPGQVAGKNIADLIICANLQGVVQDEIRERGHVLGLECRFKTAKGNEKWILQDAYLVHDAGGEAIQMVLRDITERKRAEKRLRFLSSAIEQSSEGVAVCDLVGNLLFVNQAFAAMHGYTLEEVSGKHLSIFHTPDQMASVEAANRHMRTTGGFRGEIWHVRRDGAVFPTMMHNSLLRDETGNPIGMIATLRDITEHKQAEEALRESEGLLRTVINATREAMISIGEDGLISLFNPAAEQMFGCTREEVLGKPLDCLMPEKYRERHREYVRSYFATGKPKGAISRMLELSGLRSDGHEFPMEISLSAATVGNRQFIVAVARDVTERRRAEEALRESEKRYRTTLEAMGDSIHVADADMRILLFNRAFRTWCEGLGLPSDVIGRTALDAFPFLPDRVRDEYRHVFDTGEPLITEEESVVRGRAILTETRKVPITEDGKVTQVVTIVRDVTERKRAEEQRRDFEARVQQTQKLESLGVLAGGVAHDFNNLLTGVLGNAKLALSDLAATSPARGAVEDIVTSAQRAADLCRQMLAYAGKGKFVIETVNLNDVVREMAQLLEASISNKTLLTHDLAENLPLIEADVTQIRQVVMNLITNASEALGDDPGTVSVATGTVECDRAYLDDAYAEPKLAEGLYVYLEVTDTGCGMDQETAGRIFEPFFTTKFTGRGLGLSSVQGIMRGHSGAIKVRSEPGRATTFTAIFPAHPQPAEATTCEAS